MPFETLRRLKELLPADAFEPIPDPFLPAAIDDDMPRPGQFCAYTRVPSRWIRRRRQPHSAPPRLHPSTGAYVTQFALATVPIVTVDRAGAPRGQRPRQRRCRLPRPWSPRLSAAPRRASGLCWAPPATVHWVARIGQDRDFRGARRTSSWRTYVPGSRSQPRYVAAWTRQTLDEANPTGSAAATEHNRNGSSCRFQG